MYDIRQFRPTLYLVLILGISGFCLAARAPGLWALAMLAVGLNAWLVRSGAFRPLPRWLANTVTLGAFAFCAMQVTGAGGPPILSVGVFLVLLQIVKLYEQRANRDYAQLLILSLLLMVAAAISTASLVFGVMLVLYMVVALYCCLIFHLKIEADRATAALGIREEEVLRASTIRQDQRFLPRSMRRLTVLTFSVAAVSAVMVFLMFPRGPAQGLLGQLQFPRGDALTGISEQEQFDRAGRVVENNEVVAHVFVWRNGRRVDGSEVLYLRGMTMDAYGPDPASPGQRQQWTRSRQRLEEVELSPATAFWFGPLPRGDVWRQRFVLQPTGTRLLFCLPGLLSDVNERGRVPAFRPARQLAIRHCITDGTIQAVEPLIAPLEYEVLSANPPVQADAFNTLVGQALFYVPESDPRVLAEVRQYTLRDDVAGDIVPRARLRPVDESNEKVARRIEQHLRSNFTYTLDLSDAAQDFTDSDPVVAFLTRVKRGHCRYFASAMTLMCQSVGIPARFVKGFKCDEYNPLGGYYIVRQSHAHAWVEVLTPRGWMTFDPTSGTGRPRTAAGGLLRSMQHLFDYLEFKWAEKVIAYDTRDRENLLSSLERAMMNAMYRGNETVRPVRRWLKGFSLNDLFNSVSFLDFMWNALALLIGLMAAGAVLAVAWYMVQQHRLRRRAVRIGMEGLPVERQLALARRLVFYDELLRVLGEHGLIRPRHVTPLEFARSLDWLPAEAYEAVLRMTAIFYRVRYGGAAMPATRQRRLQAQVAKLAEQLHGLDGRRRRAA